MIVECPECQTKFRLDDAKITPKGVKVRCSKCKHVFTARKQAGQDVVEISSDSAPSPKAAAPVPKPPAASAPKPAPKANLGGDTFDLKDETAPPKSGAGFDDGLGDFSFKDEPAASKSTPNSDDVGFGDLSFDDEKPPAKRPASAPSESASADDDFGDFDFDDEPAAPASSPPPAPPSPKKTAPAPKAPEPEKTAVSKEKVSTDDLDFDDFSDFSDDSGAKKPKEDIGFGGDDFDVGAGAEDSNLNSEPAKAAPPAGGDDVQEFGDISLDDVNSAAKTPSAPPPSDEIDLGGSSDAEFKLDRGTGGRSAEEFKKSVGASEDAYAFDAGPGASSEPELPTAPRQAPEPEEPRGRVAPRAAPERAKKVVAGKKKGGKGFITLLLVVIVIGGGMFYLNKQGKIKLGKIKELKFSELSADKIKEIFGIKEPDVPKDIIELDPIKSSDLYKVERSDKKTLWVLQGKITNRFQTSQWMILLEAAVKDGDETRTAQALFGNIIPADQLKSLTIDQINKKLMSTEDDNLNQRLILPNESASFMIVFPNVTGDSPILTPETVKVADHKAL